MLQQIMQMIPVPPRQHELRLHIIYTRSGIDLSALKDLHHEVGMNHTDHTDHADHTDHTDYLYEV